MTVNKLINTLKLVEDGNTRVTLNYCGDGFININSVYYERKAFGKVLTLGNYCPTGRDNLITKEKDK